MAGCALLLLAFLGGSARSGAEVIVANGQKVAFLGDSITRIGATPGGYVRLVEAGLATNGIKIAVIPAGIDGHKSNQMLARLRRDVLDKKPDWMTLSCGVNDVWKGKWGVPLDQYKTNVSSIVDQCQQARVKVLILTPTLLKEELDNPPNKTLAGYVDFLRTLSKEKHCPIADLNTIFQQAIRNHRNFTGKEGRFLTVDGIHMNPDGNFLMATGVLTAMGCSPEQIAKAQAAWQRMPVAPPITATCEVSPGKNLQVSCPLTLEEFHRFRDSVTPANAQLGDVMNAELSAEIKSLVGPGREFANPEAIFQTKKERQVTQVLNERFGKWVHSHAAGNPTTAASQGASRPSGTP